MAAAKPEQKVKIKDDFIKPCPPGIPTKQVAVTLTFRPNENPAWEINPELYIINMTYVKCTSELIMGDRIISINGIIPKSATEACSALTPNPAAPVKMVVERRKHAVPVPPERMAKIKASRLEGFAYFLVNCVNTGKQAKATLGFTLSLLKTKAHIVTVEAGSIAAQHFAIGDALLDVDGEPIPFADINFLKSFSQKFFKDGKFSVVIERPTSPLRITQYAVVYKMMLPQSDAEIEMGADAIKIGMEASAMHSLVFKKIKPKSCLTADLTNTPATTTTTMEEPERKVRMASASVITVIGSDVDDEDDLRKVERKSHAKEQMNFDDL